MRKARGGCGFVAVRFEFCLLNLRRPIRHRDDARKQDIFHYFLNDFIEGITGGALK